MTTATIHPKIAAVQELIDAREFSQALALIRESESSGRDGMSARDRLILDIQLAECLAFLGQPTDAIVLSEKVVRSLQQGNEHSLYARACFVTAVARHYLGQIDESVEDTRAALYAYKRANDAAGVVRSLNWLGNALFYKADFANALQSYRESIALASKHRMRRSVTVCRSNMARLLLLCGKLKEARASFRGNGAYYEQAGEDLGLVRHGLSIAYLNILERRFNDAERQLRELERHPSLRAHMREHGVWFEYMGEMRLAQDRCDEAAQILSNGIAVIESGCDTDESLRGQSRRLLAEVRLAQGNLAEAAAECERSLDSIRKVGERFEEGVVYRVMAEVHAQRAETGAAADAFRRSVDILRTIGARLEWAKTCLAAGRSTVFGERERLAFLFDAERLFAEIGVAYWCDQTKTALNGILHEAPAVISRQRETSDTVAGNPAIVAVGAEICETLTMARHWARQDLAILITGETGTGKDLLARYIHCMSPRRDGPFVDIDLNNIPETLWESQLFGHRRGTFTGAMEENIGLLESAAGGTVFLNEIGNLPSAMQAKLLEFLDTRQIRRLGDAHPVTLDVRFVAATNCDLQSAVDAGTFRADLYFRLEQAPLHLLPLRERQEDILPLIRYFLGELGVTEQSLQLLERQKWVERAVKERWTGNIRQLRNFLQRLVSIAGTQIDTEFASWADRLLKHMCNGSIGNGNGKHGHTTAKELVKTLERNAWNQRAAARDLEMSEGNVRHLIRRLNIRRPMEREAAA
jgi:DNA-binding NtrC family response regulator/tetratricopeptide (TPR) repeat protein